MNETIIEVIKGMLAPGIMISACGLLLLGMNNKYSMVVNRIRALNTEFRELHKNDTTRRDSILLQIPLLISRMKLIRNAVWLYTLGIAMFIFSILSIGISQFSYNNVIPIIIALCIFITALIGVLAGVIYAAKEVRLAYKILRIETNNILYTDD